MTMMKLSWTLAITLLATITSHAHLFDRALDLKGDDGDGACALSIDISALCSGLEEPFNGATCGCTLEASICGVKGSFTCSTEEFDPVMIGATAGFDNTDGSLELLATLPFEFPNLLPELPDLIANITSNTTATFEIPLSSLTDVTKYELKECSSDITLVTDLGENVNNFVNGLIDGCDCDVEGNLPLPNITITCGDLDPIVLPPPVFVK